MAAGFVLRSRVRAFGEGSDLAWRLATLAAKLETHRVLGQGYAPDGVA
jgi:hypothetical protein